MFKEHYFDPIIGRGLIAESNLKNGSTLFEEIPLVQIQYSWNKKYKYLACDECMKPLEDVEENLRRLTGNKSLIVPHKEFCQISSMKSNFSHCEKCDTRYCSVGCQVKAFKSHHQFLCPANGFISPDFLENFEQLWNEIHYPPETSNIMILVKMIAMINQAENKEAMIQSFANFCQSTFNESNYLVHKILDQKYANQIQLLFDMFRKNLYMEGLDSWFTYEGFQNLIALICRNAQGIATSPLNMWLKSTESRFKNDDGFDSFVEGIYDQIDEHVGSFIDNEGIGLYPTQSLINHSCAPNCEIKFAGDSKLSVVATRDIGQGEQVLISYLDECQLNRSRHSRQKYLREFYLFNCLCEKCDSQRCDPDVTSDEEESGDESME